MEQMNVQRVHYAKKSSQISWTGERIRVLREMIEGGAKQRDVNEWDFFVTDNESMILDYWRKGKIHVM